MSYHPAYPSSADLSREADAEDRDVADLVALRDLRRIVSDAISRAGRIDRIQHPNRRWTTADLLEVLQDVAIAAITAVLTVGLQRRRNAGTSVQFGPR
jgi:hypothetical protein